MGPAFYPRKGPHDAIFLPQNIVLECVSFSRDQTSCRSAGPRFPAVIVFWLSTTGAPVLLVNFLFIYFIYFFSFLYLKG